MKKLKKKYNFIYNFFVLLKYIYKKLILKNIYIFYRKYFRKS